MIYPKPTSVSYTHLRKQQAELIEILDRLKAANFNTVLFQTRTRGYVLYKSAIEPYNSILTGKDVYKRQTGSPCGMTGKACRKSSDAIWG